MRARTPIAATPPHTIASEPILNVGDLVCRTYVSEEQKQRVLKFSPQTTNIGIVTEIDEDHDICAVWFTGAAQTTVLPIVGEYLKVISEST
jgi:hypothetical protein